jgi:phosphate/sulfate permease
MTKVNWSTMAKAAVVGFALSVPCGILLSYVLYRLRKGGALPQEARNGDR